MQKVKIEEFIKSLGISPLNMEENSFIDISEKNKKILSYNINNKNNEFNLINKIIRKYDDYQYNILTDAGIILETSLDHKLYVKLNNLDYHYLTVEDLANSLELNEIYILNEINEEEKIKSIKKTKNKIPIFDLEVDNSHNFYTNGLLSHNSMGDPTTVSGGTAVSFYAHVRIKITRSEIDKDLRQNTMKFHFIKNKLAEPFKIGTIVYNWVGGFDTASEAGDIAIEADIIKVNGKTYEFPEIELDKKIVGKKKAMEFLKENPEYMKNVILPKVKEYLENKKEMIEEETID